MPATDDLLLAFELFRDPILAGMAAGCVLGLLSVFVLLRRMVFVTAALTQSAGLGVALSFYADIHLALAVSPVLGAVGAALLAAVLLSPSPERLRMSRDSVLALVWLVGSGGAVLVGDRISQEAHDISAILFGTAVLVRPMDLWLVTGVGALVLFLTALLRRLWVFGGFDADGARVQGVPVGLLDLVFVLLLTLQVSVCTRAIGALPVFAFSVLPGMAALLVARRLDLILLLAGLGGALSGLLGYLLAFFAELPVGASQMAVAAGLVLLALPVRLLRRD